MLQAFPAQVETESYLFGCKVSWKNKSVTMQYGRPW